MVCLVRRCHVDLGRVKVRRNRSHVPRSKADVGPRSFEIDRKLMQVGSGSTNIGPTLVASTPSAITGTFLGGCGELFWGTSTGTSLGSSGEPALGDIT